MSNFNGHFTGGLVTASVSTCAIVAVNNHYHLNLHGLDYAFNWASVLFFSLFPDVDIKSKPSKIFYSVFFVVLCYLYITKQFQTATILAMLAITPQMTNHRGFFHYKITALIIPAYVFILSTQHYLPLNVAITMYVSGVIGYYTHLILDSKL